MCVSVCINFFSLLLIQMYCNKHVLMEHFLFWNAGCQACIAHYIYLSFWKMEILVTGCMSRYSYCHHFYLKKNKQKNAVRILI